MEHIDSANRPAFDLHLHKRWGQDGGEPAPIDILRKLSGRDSNPEEALFDVQYLVDDEWHLCEEYRMTAFITDDTTMGLTITEPNFFEHRGLNEKRESAQEEDGPFSDFEVLTYEGGVEHTWTGRDLRDLYHWLHRLQAKLGWLRPSEVATMKVLEHGRRALEELQDGHLDHQRVKVTENLNACELQPEDIAILVEIKDGVTFLEPWGLHFDRFGVSEPVELAAAVTATPLALGALAPYVTRPLE